LQKWNQEVAKNGKIAIVAYSPVYGFLQIRERIIIQILQLSSPIFILFSQKTFLSEPFHQYGMAFAFIYRQKTLQWFVKIKSKEIR
jgi:hypothetical protein